jgi:hypothetical protein
LAGKGEGVAVVWDGMVLRKRKRERKGDWNSEDIIL